MTLWAPPSPLCHLLADDKEEADGKELDLASAVPRGAHFGISHLLGDGKEDACCLPADGKEVADGKDPLCHLLVLCRLLWQDRRQT